MVSGVNTLKVDLIDKMGSDLSVVNAARVSFAKKSDWDHSIPFAEGNILKDSDVCLLYTSPSPRDGLLSRMPSSA